MLTLNAPYPSCHENRWNGFPFFSLIHLDVLDFTSYDEARVFRSSFMRLVIYAILFIIGYRFNLVFDNVPDGRIFDGYCMAALFCGLSVLSGFMNNMICIGGCLTMLIFMLIKLTVSMAIGIIVLPICVFMNLYHLVKNGIVIMESANFGAKSNKNTQI